MYALCLRTELEVLRSNFFFFSSSKYVSYVQNKKERLFSGTDIPVLLLILLHGLKLVVN